MRYLHATNNVVSAGLGTYVLLTYCFGLSRFLPWSRSHPIAAHTARFVKRDRSYYFYTVAAILAATSVDIVGEAGMVTRRRFLARAMGYIGAISCLSQPAGRVEASCRATLDDSLPKPRTLGSGFPAEDAGDASFDFRYAGEGDTACAPGSAYIFDQTVLRSRAGASSGCHATFHLASDDVLFRDANNHILSIPLAQGSNREHFISSIGSPYWTHAMGVLVSRSGMAFELWSKDSRFTSRAEVWSNTGYWIRQGLNPTCPVYDPEAQVNRYCADSIFAAGRNESIPRGTDLTVACQVKNRGDGWLSLFAWVSADRGVSRLCYGGMGVPLWRVLAGECFRQGVGKAVAGCDHHLRATFEYSYFFASR